MAESQEVPTVSFDIKGIIEHQRNRYPVLLIDRISSAVPGKSATGIKSFTYNEWFFPGHFEDEPLVPGFILVECLAQTFIMTFLSLESYKGMKTNFVSINNVRFSRKVVPGDTLVIQATLQSFRRGLAMGSVQSFVNDEAVCSADLVVAVPDVMSRFTPKS